MNKNSDRADVATHIVTYCSRCDNNTNHIVVAKGDDGIVARVKCIVCSSEHKYKRTGIKTYKTTNPSSGSCAGPKGLSRSTAQYDRKLWEEALTTAINKVPENYLISASFQKGNLIYHSSMGEGVVIKSYDNKIEVIFKEGIKVLVHNRKK